MNRREVIKTALGAAAAIVAVPAIAEAENPLAGPKDIAGIPAPAYLKEDIRTPEEVFAQWDTQVSQHIEDIVTDAGNRSKYWKGVMHVDRPFWNRLVARLTELGQTPDIRNFNGREGLVIHGCLYIITY